MFAKAFLYKQFVEKLVVIFALVLLVANVHPFKNNALAGEVYDQNLGTWTNTFTDETGLSSTSNVGVNSNTLKLKNAGGGYTAPFSTSGWAITNTFIPTSAVRWGTLTINKNTPANTSVTVQILDEASCVFPNALLSGNESGFTGTSIDISGLPVDRNANCSPPGNEKILRLRFKIILSTTDTNVTPTVDSLSFSWTTKQGDLSTAPLANTAWSQSETDAQGTRHNGAFTGTMYPAIRWVKDQGVNYAGDTIRGFGDIIYNKTPGGTVSWPTVAESQLSAINRKTGATVWERNISGTAFSDTNQALSNNGTLYISDIYHDVLLAYDTADGSLKWTYQFNGGHGNSNVNIGSDGTIYTVRDNALNVVVIYAFNPDGTVKWARTIVFPDGRVIAERQLSFSPNGTVVYYGSSVVMNSPPYNYTNEGMLYALKTSDGTDFWAPYPTGDINADNSSEGVTVDTDGTIYAMNTTNVTAEKKIYAINPNRTLKWQRNVGSTTDYWAGLSLRSDHVLLAERVQPYPSQSGALEAMDTDNGSLLWSIPVTSDNGVFGSNLFSDGADGAYLNTNIYTVNSSLIHYDANHNLKWKLTKDLNGVYYSLAHLIQDESGNIYGNFTFGSSPSNNKLFSISPWTITPGITNVGNIYRGNTLTFSIKTSMQQTNLLTGGTNKMQLVMDNGTVVPLTYDSTDVNGDTIWTGNYVVPADYGYGTHSYTVQASAVNIQTDVAVNFSSPPTDSGNTGITQAGSFTVSQIPENPTPTPPTPQSNISNDVPKEQISNSQASQPSTTENAKQPAPSDDNKDTTVSAPSEESEPVTKPNTVQQKTKDSFGTIIFKGVASGLIGSLILITITFFVLFRQKRLST